MLSDQEYFDECRTLFMAKGWELYMGELKEAIDAIRLEGINSSDEFWKAKGRLEAFTQMYGWESFVKAAEEQYDASDS
jgi:hypothetical protein